MRVQDRAAERMMMANPSTSASRLKDDSPPMNATTKRLTRNMGRKRTLRVRPQNARWRALCAHKPEYAGCIRAAEGHQQHEPHQRRNQAEGVAAEQGAHGFAGVDHENERDGQSGPEYFGHA